MSERAKFVFKHGITSAQADVLRRAARKWVDYYGKDQKLYDGTVHTYGLRQDTLAALQTRLLIVKEHTHKDREARLIRAEDLIAKAFDMARSVDPYSKQMDGITAWNAVLVDLQVAKATFASLNETCLRITPLGREVAAEWKKSINAEEE